MNVTLWVAFLAGLVSFLSPCVFPLVPAYIGYMGGRVTQTVSAEVAGGGSVAVIRPIDRVSTVAHGAMFVAGFTLVFVVFGLLTTAFIRQVGGQNVALVREVIGRAGGLLIIFFGLQFMGVLPALMRRAQSSHAVEQPFFSVVILLAVCLMVLWAAVDWLLALPLIVMIVLAFVLGGAFTRPQHFWDRLFERMQRFLYADTRRQMTAGQSQHFSASLLMGVVFAAGWTPCIGPIYGSILTMAATGASVGEAGLLMLVYSLGLGLPFLICALLLDSAQGLLRRMRGVLPLIEKASGVFLIVIGILVASGRLQMLSQNFATEFADLSYRLEECAVGLNNGEVQLGEFGDCVSGANETAGGQG